MRVSPELDYRDHVIEKVLFDARASDHDDLDEGTSHGFTCIAMADENVLLDRHSSMGTDVFVCRSMRNTACIAFSESFSQP